MGNRWTWLYFGALPIQILIRRPYIATQRAALKIDRRVDRSEQALFGALSIGVFVLPLVASLSPWLRRADYDWPAHTQRRMGILGSILMAASLWLFWRSHADLGRNWSPTLEISDRQELVVDGVYRLIRHPMYASQLLWCMAQALLVQNNIAGPAGFIAFLLLYLVRVPREEQMMLDHYGDDYRAYMARTGRILPRLPR